MSQHDNQRGPGRHSLHWPYLYAAHDSLMKTREIAAEPEHGRVRIQTEMGEIPVGWILRIDKEERLNAAVISCVLFSALATEAYANCLLRERLSTFFRDKLDSMDMVAKIVLALRCAFNFDLDPGTDVCAGLVQLQRRRNKLAHAKPSYYQLTDEDWDRYQAALLKPEDAEESMKTCLAVIELVASIDPTFESGPRNEYKFRCGQWQELLNLARNAVRKA